MKRAMCFTLAILLAFASATSVSAVTAPPADALTGGMVYATWSFGQTNLSEVNVVIQVRTIPIQGEGIYLQVYERQINGKEFYFGLQTMVGKPSAGLTGKGLVFSQFGTTDTSNIRTCPGGWFEAGTYEGPFISTRCAYEWTSHTYDFCVRFKETDSVGDWYEFWLTDLVTGEQTNAGALRFAFPSSPLLRGIADGGCTWMERYYPRSDDAALAEFNVSILEVSARSQSEGLLFPRMVSLRTASNFLHVDQSFHADTDVLDFRTGGSALKSFDAMTCSLTTGTLSVSATMNGKPWDHALQFTLTRCGTYQASVVPMTVTGAWVGSYAVSYVEGAPSGVALLSNTAPQRLVDGGTANLVMAFTSGPVLDHFEVDVEPIVHAGIPFTIGITARDQYENPFTDFNGTAALSLTHGSITPTLTPQFTAGRLVNFVVTVAEPTRDVILSVTSQGVSGQSGVFQVVPQSLQISASASGGGSISPSGNISVPYGAAQTFVVAPDTGYEVFSIIVDGSVVSTGPAYTFTSVTAPHTISVIFNKVQRQTVLVLHIGQTAFTVDGSPRALDAPPVILRGRTLLPVRAVIEALGGMVTWEASEKKATVVLRDVTLVLSIGHNLATVNGVETPIDAQDSGVVPLVMNSRTMLPLRFVAENLGCTVDWDAATKTVTVIAN